LSGSTLSILCERKTDRCGTKMDSSIFQMGSLK